MFSADQLQHDVYTLVNARKHHTVSEIENSPEFDNFRKDNKMIYDMIVKENDFNEEIFKELIRMKRRLEAGEDQYSVDVRFGQFMADRYLAPIKEKLDKNLEKKQV